MYPKVRLTTFKLLLLVILFLANIVFIYKQYSYFKTKIIMLIKPYLNMNHLHLRKIPLLLMCLIVPIRDGNEHLHNYRK